jgi:hypothetical protein
MFLWNFAAYLHIMKHASLLTPVCLLLVAMLTLTSCGRKKEQVKLQVKTINYEHQLVVNRLDALERSLESYVPSIMDKAYQDVMNQLDSSTVLIKGLKTLKEDEDLKDDAMLLFDTYRLLLENEYSEMVKRQKKPAGTFTAADEFLVANLGKHIAVNRKKAKEKFENEAARILALYDIPFDPVQPERSDTIPSTKP